MERLKKSRAPVRSAVTRVVNDIERELIKDEADRDLIESKAEYLREISLQLEEWDQRIKDQLLDDDSTEEAQDAEYISIEEYRMKIITSMNKIKKMMNRESPPVSPTPSVYSTASGGKKSFKLPKIQLKKFSGDLKEWLGWWSQFMKIDEDEELHASDKFQYLLQCMVPGSRARGLVESFPMTSSNYPKAISALKERFGKEKFLQQVYVRELLRLVISTAKSKETVILSKLYDDIETQLRALESLGVKAEHSNQFLFPMVESCLPEETLMAWQRSPFRKEDGSKMNPPKGELDLLMEFLRDEVECEETRKLVRAGFEMSTTTKDGDKKKNNPRVRNREDDIPTAASLFVKSDGESKGCNFCLKLNHASQDCFKAAKMTVEEKRKIIKDNNNCFVCMKKGHSAKNCRSNVKCSYCSKKHYLVMCPEVEEMRRKSESSKDGMEELEHGVSTMSATPVLSNSSQAKVILLKTLHLLIKGTNGQEREVRVVFDTGSQRSYIKTSLTKELKCQVLNQITMQNSLFGGHTTEIRTRQNFKVAATGINGVGKRNLELINEDVICASCPIIPIGPWIQELAKKRIYLTDTYADSKEIEILIGADLYETLVTGKRCQLKCGLVAAETVFGWTLCGEIRNPEPSYTASVISMLTCDEKSLPNLWSLEAIGIKDTAERISQEEHDVHVKKSFQDQITRDEDGRYVVSLPWISKDLILPSNRAVAEKRLVNATMKLKKQDEFYNYGKIFDEWEKEGIVEITRVKTDDPDHYLPHRPVFKPNSLTTPVRPVFDASCKVGRNPSLNQCLEKGPNLLELIPSILMRFREKNIGVISDIRKAFQMVKVKEEDRNFQKFLWWEDENKESFREYQHCRVVFGLNCSPFILAAVLEHHLDHAQEEDKLTADLLKKSLYVDNVVTSLDTEDEHDNFKEKSIKIMAAAKMDLRQWESSIKPITGDSVTNVLGLKWNKEKDVLYCQLPKNERGAVTKRSVLSTVAQIFDPIGFTCPALLQPKMMLQDSWAVDLGWDQEWTETNREKFSTWWDELESLNWIRIPRNAFGNSAREKVQIHCFCDASKSAYAAVVFARVEFEDKVSVQLLMAKSRLAPLDKKKTKRVTIPRLELLSCLIGSRLTQMIKSALSMEDIHTIYWNDSTTSLAWIRRDEDWGKFVGNRVREINNLTINNEWRHVPGHMNPADLPSRGCSPKELLESKWWEGPNWLRHKDLWPSQANQGADEEEVASERKKSESVMSAMTVITEPRFSSYLKNVKVAGWIRRFLENSKKGRGHRNNSKFLSLDEMKRGERDLLFQVQQRHYPIPPKLKTLHVDITGDRLYHVKTRLNYRDDTELFRHPILLPKDDPLVNQLINYIHRANCHAGTQFVLGKLREKYWIVQGRKTIGRVIHKCVICRRYGATAMKTEPAPLPIRRIQARFAFETTGVDLAGPIQLKGGKKCWIVLYTCAVYRGIYFDVVDSISSEEFLDSLEKFTYAVGRPNTIYSDNGTNFVGAHNMMKKLDWSRLEQKLHVKEIKWVFNPPTAAWWGGWWERLVRTTKDLLRKMIGSAKLTRKELEKCLAAISHTINSRPLTTLTEDNDDLIPLTLVYERFADCWVAGERSHRVKGSSRRLQKGSKFEDRLERKVSQRILSPTGPEDA